MKKRTGILGVLIAVLILGIGYSAISAVNLKVTGSGTITADQNNFDVHFKDVTGNGPEKQCSVTGATVEATYTDDLNATINISGFTKKDDEATVVYFIENGSEDIDALLSTPVTVTNSNSEYFEVTATLNDTELAANGGMTSLVINVKAIKTPVTEDATTNITATVVANPVSN